MEGHSLFIRRSLIKKFVDSSDLDRSSFCFLDVIHIFQTMPDIATITHVIFDFDGVILDSERVFSEANDRVLQKYGKSFNNDIKIGMMGRTQVEGARWVLESVGLAQEVDVTTYLDDYQLELEHLIKKADVLPGIRRLVEHLYAHGIPMAICTSSDIDVSHWKFYNTSAF